jgi:hypothetical protein
MELEEAIGLGRKTVVKNLVWGICTSRSTTGKSGLPISAQPVLSQDQSRLKEVEAIARFVWIQAQVFGSRLRAGQQ